jgi:hypothetical protein
MNADVLLTIYFTLYAVLIAVGAGLVFARNWNKSALDEPAEKRFNGRPPHGHAVRDGRACERP